MKIVATAALIAAQIVSAQPAFAADLVDGPTGAQTRIGAFAGARFRVALGGPRHARLRAGLSVAPISVSRTTDGRSALRYGEGLEFGIAGREPATLRLAGYRLAPGGTPVDEQGRPLGVSTLGYAGIAASVIVVSLLALALIGRSDNDR